ncbi:MAG: DUF1822 family protein [Xenococcaceae cyanobacterium MO_188.B29]|nr:DUF1822 family protein [Xenococcaceae cyanobacterium MO_188.B29]
MLSLHKLSISYPNQLWLKITKEIQQKSWQRSQSYSNPTSRCQAYLNDVCWQTFIPWLQAWLEEDGSDSGLITHQYSPNIWEFVNGSVINLEQTKIALIPSETSDLEEFDIPQEGVDIPQWQADYYLAIQVNFDVSEEAWIRVRGYVSYQQLKHKGEYEESDRSYYISQEYLEEDITAILLSPQAVAQKKQELVTSTELSSVIANQLLDKLGNPVVYYPRLAIPFSQWTILITNPEWRQKLFEQRTGLAKVSLFNSQAINLQQWLQELTHVVEESWQTVENLLTPLEPISVRGYRYTEETITKEAITPLIQLLKPHNPEKERTQAAGILGKIGAGYPEAISALTELLHTAKEEETRWQAALSLGEIDPGNADAGRAKGKLIDLGIQLENQKIALIVAIMAQTQDRVGVWIQLKPAHESIKLPPHLKLSILSDEKTILEAETRSDPEGKGKDGLLQLRFTPPSGTHFQVEVSLNEANFTEYFDA